MQGRVYAKLNHGMDSFIRVTSILRRKEFKVKALSMSTDSNAYTNLDIVLDSNDFEITQMINVIAKLVDVKEIKLLREEM